MCVCVCVGFERSMSQELCHLIEVSETTVMLVVCVCVYECVCVLDLKDRCLKSCVI